MTNNFRGYFLPHPVDLWKRDVMGRNAHLRIIFSIAGCLSNVLNDCFLSHGLHMYIPFLKNVKIRPYLLKLS